MTELPEPLTPATCDMRGLTFMPLDVTRLLDSDLFAISTGEEFKAAFALWAKSWYQQPAASLPDDDRVLAHLSGAGRDWSQVKDIAMRGWVLCNDGRWYHPVVAEKAIEAMGRRVEHKESVSGQNERKERERTERKLMMAALRAAGESPAWNILTRDLRDRYSKLSQNQRDSRLGENGQLLQESGGSQPPATAEGVTGHRPDTAKTGTGTGTNQNNHPPKETPRGASPPRNQPKPNPKFVSIQRAAGWTDFPTDMGQVIAEWDADDIELDWSILPAIREAAAEARGRGGKQPFRLRFFDSAVREKHAERQREFANLERIRRENADAPPHPDTLAMAAAGGSR